MSLVETGKYISLILRHKPLAISITLAEQGLIPKSRLYVHLSPDTDTAVKVGQRHGKPVIYRVLSKAMVEKGYKFYLSVNGVWLTKAVPVEFLEKLR